MPTTPDVHAAIDQRCIDFLSDIPINFGNIEDTVNSEGHIPYLDQKVVFLDDNQFILGDTQNRKKTGSLIFVINVRRNTGDGDRNALAERVLKLFRSQVIGGATFLNGRAGSSASTENWSMTSIEIPFYFYDMQ